MPFKPASRALSRFTVLDLTRVRSGPTAVRQLADWGANVIKIETPPELEPGEGPGGPRHGPDFQNLHRNKRSLTLNLKSEEGKAILRRLVETADVIVENYRPDVKHRLGIAYEQLAAVNPRLVYASISGFGQDGPYATRPGFDQIAQGLGGLMSITGLPGQGPVRVGIPVADLTAGLYCSLGIMVALLAREETGKGQWVQTSLLQAQIAMLDFQAARWLMDGDVPKQAGNNHPTSIPTGVFQTADGHINIAATGQAIWERFCRAVDRADLISHPDYVTATLRSRNRDGLGQEINAILKTQNGSYWIARFSEFGVPCGPINRIDEVFADPQVQHVGIAQSIHSPALARDITLVGQPVQLSDTPSSIRVPPPEQGEQSDEILGEVGFSPAEIAAFHANGTI
ncbi:CoA transferase [Bosea sp. (in: a-proteobacteria)]|uniref:CaiB/BaiF CoA transferase family protein n=1 Tax=Bosea sp. (in: a-proteobacteria) TaxID=1871050 RepID=UPI0025B80232|nr:CoA transferase [Bosea sp. (in: a-proteobacteria)]MBR3189387.1 CoA transferase [Bosea sp. (in: a-proteobacteria)]